MEVRRYLVEGRVQGVGFRNYAAKKARSIGLRGWVRNLIDGRVEALAQGQPEQLQEFEKYLHRGPEASQVSGVKVACENVNSPLQDVFEIRWTEG